MHFLERFAQHVGDEARLVLALALFGLGIAYDASGNWTDVNTTNLIRASVFVGVGLGALVGAYVFHHTNKAQEAGVNGFFFVAFGLLFGLVIILASIWDGNGNSQAIRHESVLLLAAVDFTVLALLYLADRSLNHLGVSTRTHESFQPDRADAH